MKTKMRMTALAAGVVMCGSLQAAVPFLANPGVTGAWFDPSTDGQGFLVELVPNENLGNLFIVTWYTFAPNGTSAKAGSDSTFWLTGTGQMGSGNRAEVSFARTSGGEFNNPQAVSRSVGWATGTWTFNNCDSATFNYNLPNVTPPQSGTINLVRVVPDYMCSTGGLVPIHARWAGTYSGTWNNLSFNTSGASNMTIVSNANGTRSYTWDLDGQVFGATDPAPISFTIDPTRPGEPVTGTDPTFGPYTATFKVDGSFTLDMNPPGFDSMRMVGNASPSHFAGEYTIFAGGNAFANGTVSMWRRP